MKILAQEADQSGDGNPYIHLLYENLRAVGGRIKPLNRRRLLERQDIVHVHWPEMLVEWRRGPLFAIADSVKCLIGIAMARLRGARLAWTGHNLAPHELPHPRIHAAFSAIFQRMVDLVITLSPAGGEALQTRYSVLRRKTLVTIPHGHYRDAYGAKADRVEARRQLDLPLEGRIFLLLGMIRRYKNVPALIRAFDDHANGSHLLIAGKIGSDAALEDEVRQAATRARGVTLHLHHVPAPDVPLYHAAADVVVLPYTSGTALNSGAAILALSFDRPVVVQDSGAMADLQALVGTQWLARFSGDASEALAEAERLAARERPDDLDLSALDWPPIGQATLDAFRSVLR